MKKLLSIGIALTTAVALLLGAGEASATQARRTSLGANQLILDSTDVFNFPQLTVDYSQHVMIDYGVGVGNNTPGAWDNGSALLLLGSENLAYGVGIFHGDLFNSTTNIAAGHTLRNSFPHNLTSLNLGNVANPWAFGPVEVFSQPHTILDLFGAMKSGNMKLGARLAFGHGGQSAYDAAADETNSVGNNFINLDAGVSIDSGFRLDTGLKILVDFASQKEGDLTSLSGFLFGADLFGRAYMPMTNRMELGVLGNLAFTSLSLDNKPDDATPTTTSSNTSLGVLAGVGPVYRIADNSTIAGYGIVGYTNLNNDPNTDNNDDADSAGFWYLPGMQLAADIQIVDWLFFRTGLQYSYVVATGSEETPDGDDKTTATTSLFGWRAGLGVTKGNFTLDGVLQNNFLTDGPFIVGGVGNGLFTTLSAGYRF